MREKNMVQGKNERMDYSFYNHLPQKKKKKQAKKGRIYTMV